MQLRRRSLVGDDFSRRPFISGIGALICLSRLNHLRPADYRFAFGFSVTRADDRNVLLTFSGSRKRSLVDALMLPRASQLALQLASWLPFRVSPTLAFADYRFRFCPSCLRYGYHTLLQEMPWISRCPWHGDALRETCARCNRTLVLDGLAGSWLTVCKCGHDHFNERASVHAFESVVQARRLCGAYLRWARVHRKRSLLLGHPLTWEAWTDMAGCVRLPEELVCRAGPPPAKSAHTHRSRLSRSGAPKAVVEDHASIAAKLEDIQQVGSAMIDVPRSLRSKLEGVAARLVSVLPPGSLSARELALFLGDTAPVGLLQTPAQRPTTAQITTLAPSTVAGRTFLNISAIHPSVRQLSYALLQFLGETMSRSPRNYHDLDCALSAVYEVIARGYAEGLRNVIARYVPGLMDLGREAPHLSEPWAIVERSGAGLYVRTFWKSAKGAASYGVNLRGEHVPYVPASARRYR